jgi:hypothetical protein
VRAVDFLVKVPSQANVRGTRFESIVAETLPVYGGQPIERGGVSLVSRGNGVAFGTVRQGGVQWGSQVWPSSFTAVVRRAS